MQKLESGSLPESADMLSDDLLEVVAGGTKSRSKSKCRPKCAPKCTPTDGGGGGGGVDDGGGGGGSDGVTPT